MEADFSSIQRFLKPLTIVKLEKRAPEPAIPLVPLKRTRSFERESKGDDGEMDCSSDDNETDDDDEIEQLCSSETVDVDERPRKRLRPEPQAPILASPSPTSASVGEPSSSACPVVGVSSKEIDAPAMPNPSTGDVIEELSTSPVIGDEASNLSVAEPKLPSNDESCASTSLEADQIIPSNLERITERQHATNECSETGANVGKDTEEPFAAPPPDPGPSSLPAPEPAREITPCTTTEIDHDEGEDKGPPPDEPDSDGSDVSSPAVPVRRRSTRLQRSALTILSEDEDDENIDGGELEPQDEDGQAVPQEPEFKECPVESARSPVNRGGRLADIEDVALTDVEEEEEDEDEYLPESEDCIKSEPMDCAPDPTPAQVPQPTPPPDATSKRKLAKSKKAVMQRRQRATQAIKKGKLPRNAFLTNEFVVLADGTLLPVDSDTLQRLARSRKAMATQRKEKSSIAIAVSKASRPTPRPPPTSMTVMPTIVASDIQAMTSGPSRVPRPVVDKPGDVVLDSFSSRDSMERTGILQLPSGYAGDLWSESSKISLKGSSSLPPQKEKPGVYHELQTMIDDAMVEFGANTQAAPEVSGQQQLSRASVDPINSKATNTCGTAPHPSPKRTAPLTPPQDHTDPINVDEGKSDHLRELQRRKKTKRLLVYYRQEVRNQEKLMDKLDAVGDLLEQVADDIRAGRVHSE